VKDGMKDALANDFFMRLIAPSSSGKSSVFSTYLSDGKTRVSGIRCPRFGVTSASSNVQSIGHSLDFKDEKETYLIILQASSILCVNPSTVFGLTSSSYFNGCAVWSGSELIIFTIFA
jgi:hypothetical protein